MAKLYNRVAVSTATTGTGTVTLGSALSGAFCTFGQAGAQDSDVVSYLLTEGSDFEVGRGTYTASGTTLSRDTVLLSKISGVAGTSKMSLGGGAEVRIVVLAEDVAAGGGGGGGGAFSGALVRKAADQTSANYTSATAIAWDQESYDEGGWHDNVTNNTRLTVPSGVSRVRLSAGIILGGVSSDQHILLQIHKNGNVSYDGPAAQRSEVGTVAPHISVTGPAIEVTAGDYFEAVLLVESDTSINILATFSWFAIEQVGD